MAGLGLGSMFPSLPSLMFPQTRESYTREQFRSETKAQYALTAPFTRTMDDDCLAFLEEKAGFPPNSEDDDDTVPTDNLTEYSKWFSACLNTLKCCRSLWDRTGPTQKTLR